MVPGDTLAQAQTKGDPLSLKIIRTQVLELIFLLFILKKNRLLLQIPIFPDVSRGWLHRCHHRCAERETLIDISICRAVAPNGAGRVRARVKL